MTLNIMKNFIWITPCREYAQTRGSKKGIVVKKMHLFPILSHWFQIYHEIAARYRVFHDHIETRINMGDAREIRILIEPKMKLI